VKNVAGYDLARLFCGSRGSLGMITSATFKLAPLPAASRTVAARFATVQQAAAAGVALADSPLTPSAVELMAPEPRLLVRFETTERAAAHMAASAEALLAGTGSDVVTLDSAAEERAWREHVQLEARGDGMHAAISVLPATVPVTLEMVATLAARCGLTWSATGRVAIGLLRVCVAGEQEAQRQFTAALRTTLGEAGHVQLSGGGQLVSEDAWNPMGSAAAVALAVKRQFDPLGVLPYAWSRN
jgi:glycolate oxidase FAD binding subunit